MRFSTRSKVSIAFSVVAIVGVLGMLMATGVFIGRVSGVHAADSGIHAVADKAAKAITVNPANIHQSARSSHSTYVLPYHPAHSGGAGVNLANVPRPAGVLSGGTSKLLHNFNGVSSVDSFKVNGFDVEPPDQGLCVGNGFVMEPVNLAFKIYHPNGTVIEGPISLPSFFDEPPAFTPPETSVQGDGRCFFDPTTNTWFATQLFLTTTLKHNFSHFDLAVNPSGNPTTPWTIYRFNTTDLNDPGCPCFGDQPLFGIDQFNIYISTNEFSIAGPPFSFNGAQVYAISKSQLVSLASSVDFVHFGNLGIGGTIAASVEPAITDDANANAEYFLNSLDPNATFDHRIGVWAMTARQRVSSGGIPNFSSVVINSEAYGQPPLATDPSGFKINSDDDRMLQVQFINGQLWSSLNTGITIPGDSAERVGAAWFEVHPFLKGSVIGGASITDQGYVFSSGNYLMYPAVVSNRDGNAAMVMTLMGPGTFPSAVYAVRPASSGHHDFSAVHVAAAGATSDHGFTCTDPATGDICRWGDYSAAVISPSGEGIWMATEYIPGAGDQFANWGTRVFEVAA